MRDPDPPLALHRDHPLWVSLSQYRIGPADAALGFEQRLARENGWNEAKAARVVEEYKRFCFLAATAGHEVTPSDAVDQAWHLHLTYSRDYWERFCPEVLGRPLHHGPTAGGADDRARFFEQYAETLKSYERTFGEGAPDDLWPAAARRFGEDPKARRVHPRDYLLIPRRAAGLLLLLVAIAFILFVLLR
jgi:hypothetical protein